MPFGERFMRVRKVAEHQIEAGSADDFKGADAVAAGSAQVREQCDRRCRIAQPHAGGSHCLRARKQFQHGGGNDAERAFRADEQLFQVVAGVVLAQGAQAVPDAPVRQHHFQPEHQIAHRAIAQHVDAAGIGGKIAANFAMPD